MLCTINSISHNYGINEQVSMDLGIDHVAIELLFNMHPMLMFTRERSEERQAIFNSFC